MHNYTLKWATCESRQGDPILTFMLSCSTPTYTSLAHMVRAMSCPPQGSSGMGLWLLVLHSHPPTVLPPQQWKGWAGAAPLPALPSPTHLSHVAGEQQLLLSIS